jgi:glycosyltransferase involved in cell wall biosynthesis
MEGFGLPVIESLAHGKPCICSGGGALGESAQGGGCIGLETMDAPSLAAAMTRLLHAPQEIAALGTQARARRFKTWDEYANELGAWIAALRNSSRTAPL